ncbi:MAG TPA: methyltransferase domain-containing protein [Natronosporangium sp.]
MTAAAKPDLAAIKQKQQRMWAGGDYSAVATRIVPIAERLTDAADLKAGSTVLDVATGSGNAAIAAARCGCQVTGVDYVPSLLARARERAAAERLEIRFVEGDAEDLPFPDASFDAVISVVGVMFAPDQPRAASELLRVCRPGGTIALANWTPDGFIGAMLRTMTKHVPPPPGVEPPGRWGTEERLQELLGGGTAGMSVERRTFTMRYRSAEEFVDFFSRNYGPTVAALSTLDEAGQQALREDLAHLVLNYNRYPTAAPLAIPADYLEVVAIRS